MSQYRKKPVVIEARQWLGGEYAWLTDFCGQNWTRADARDMHFDDPEQVIVYDSAERQWLPVPVGHWIVRGVQGELYPCEPDIFTATHESVPPPCVDCNGTGCRLIKVENFIAQTEECGACRGTGFALPPIPSALPDEAGEMVKRLEKHAAVCERDGQGILARNFREAASLIERLAPRWISVEERLPERNTTILVWIGWTDVATFEPRTKRLKSQQWFSEPAGINPCFSVTHWMPLPLPPQKGST